MKNVSSVLPVKVIIGPFIFVSPIVKLPPTVKSPEVLTTPADDIPNLSASFVPVVPVNKDIAPYSEANFQVSLVSLCCINVLLVPFSVNSI